METREVREQEPQITKHGRKYPETDAWEPGKGRLVRCSGFSFSNPERRYFIIRDVLSGFDILLSFPQNQASRKDVTMTNEERRDLIAKYAAGFAEVTKALDGFPQESLSTNVIPGKWSAKEIVHHLADSESTSAIRLRRLLVEESPVIQGYDQDAFAVRLKYNERDMAPALDAFRSARETTVQLLHLMSEEDWQREGIHTESGRYTPELWLSIYAAHAHNHAAQIRRLRDALNS